MKQHIYKGISFWYCRTVKAYMYTIAGKDIIGGDMRQTKFSIDQIYKA